jgi:UDP-N-acetylglucosamine/UDP-N-acetylgalactosamine 4-epimerase
MQKVLITGGAGFIGSHIVEHFLKRGHYVRILDDFSSGSRSNLLFLKKYPKNRWDIIRGDIRSQAICLRSCKGMNYVVHQAALKTVPKSIKNPHIFNDVNINGTLNLLQAAVEHKIKRFVFASSSSVYGNSKTFPQRETHVPDPISPYGVTKLAGERYCAVFSHLYGLETVCLRYFNVFGPRQPFNDTYSAVIVKFINCFLNNENPPVFGNGKQSRDFTFVSNVVLANELALFKPGLKHEILNAATGKTQTILKLVNCLQSLTQKKIKPKFLPLRQGDIFKSYSDVSKIKKRLGYKPNFTFEEGLAVTVDYLRSIKK